jgi:hypothetical protein
MSWTQFYNLMGVKICAKFIFGGSYNFLSSKIKGRIINKFKIHKAGLHVFKFYNPKNVTGLIRIRLNEEEIV